MKQLVQQAKVEMKCIFCGTTTYFEDNNKAYCIDCYCKIRNSAHTHDLPKNTPITPMPTAYPGIGGTTTISNPRGRMILEPPYDKGKVGIHLIC